MNPEDSEFFGCRLDTPERFSDEKGTPDYWQRAVNEFWASTNFDTDEFDLRAIVNWFDDYRQQ